MSEPTSSDQMVNRAPDISSSDNTLLAWHRSHMANERTFLSWCRTSISLLGFGFVIDKFEVFMFKLGAQGRALDFQPGGEAIFLSVFCYIVAGVTIAIGGYRFISVRKHINEGSARFSVIPDALVMAATIAVAVLAILLARSKCLYLFYSG
jgi:putative membrane protein